MGDYARCPRIAGPLLLVLALSLQGCKTTDGGDLNLSDMSLTKGLKAISGGEYGIFWDQGDHLAELVDAGEFAVASQLYAGQHEYFATNGGEHAGTLAKLAKHLNEARAPALLEARADVDGVDWPLPPGKWASARQVLTSAQVVADDYQKVALLQEKGFRSPHIDPLLNALRQKKAAIRTDAPAQLSSYDIFSAGHFFESYPVDTDPKRVWDAIGESLPEKLSTGSVEQIARIVGLYRKSEFSQDAWTQISNAYLGAQLRSTSHDRTPDIDTVLAAVDRSHDAGFAPTRLADFGFSFIEVTSQSLLKQGQIEFAAEVKVDLPVEATKADIDEALGSDAALGADYLIIFDVAMAKASRRITTKENKPSRFIAGYRTKPNPNYNLAQNKVNQAQISVQGAAMNKASIDSQYCQGAGCWGKVIAQIAAGVQQSQAQETLQEAMNTLASTPMTLEEPVYQEYQYELGKVDATKLMTVNYYVIDKSKETFFKSVFDIEEHKSFDVAYGVHDKDTRRNRIFGDADTDEEVAEWEEQPASVRLSALVDHYLGNRNQSQKLTSLNDLRSDILAEKNRALRVFEATRYDARPLNDPRFDSVVVVYARVQRGKALGSGFFVAPDVVMTNFHVVEGATFVEMKMYDGQETFGKVIASDAIRDLAAIRVQSRGKPVEFFQERSLALGATVEGIGHPRGLEFSITRGVISAVRKQPTIAVAGNREEVLFIQTDAPVNEGNSGGPLFLGDKVVGVNTQGVRKDVAEGLNFAVHYSEAVSFLRDALPGLTVASGS